MADPTPLSRGRDAAARGDWRRAYALLAEADADGCVGGSDLAQLAGTAYAAGHVAATIDAWERLHIEALQAGDPLTAAGSAVRVALHLLFDTALLAPIRGWAARAERLLAGRDDTRFTPGSAWSGVTSGCCRETSSARGTGRVAR